MNRHSIISLAAALLGSVATPATLHAQNLNREIAVEREITPTEREASRLPLLPTVSLPQVPTTSLAFSRIPVVARVPATAAFLEPTAWTDSLSPGNPRGYASLGLFPLWNCDLSAGYRIVDKKKVKLNAWLQYQGNVYRKSTPEPIVPDGFDHRNPLWRDHRVDAAVSTRVLSGENGMLSATVAYGWNRYNNRPQISGNPTFWESTSDLLADVQWQSTFASLDYNMGVKYRHFQFGDTHLDTSAGEGSFPGPLYPTGLFDISGTHQNEVKVDLGGSFLVSDISHLGLDLGLDVLSTGNHQALLALHGTTPRDGFTTGVFTLTPYYKARSNRWSIFMGPRIDITFNGGKALHIAPDIRAGWNPSAFFALEVNAGGGEHLNPLSALAPEAMRMAPFMGYELSHLPITAGATITIGPRHGAWLQLIAQWAKANSWLMPTAINDPTAYGSCGMMAFENVDISGGIVGVRAGVAAGSWLEAEAGFLTSTSNDANHAFYMWRDRAHHVLDATVTLKPLPTVTIAADWELRMRRSLSYLGDVPQGSVVTQGWHNLHNSSQLSLTATWAYTPRLSFFITGRNLLSHTYQLIDLTPAQGISAMVGAAVKF